MVDGIQVPAEVSASGYQSGQELGSTDPPRARLPPRTRSSCHPPGSKVRQHFRQRPSRAGQDWRSRPRCRSSRLAGCTQWTPEFMAPELYEEEYNELVDIYSFGMCVLEMLTSEYPYSECSNPAQIYKKVTSGKLPEAFYRIQDRDARRFVGRCLETVSKRSSAQDLLLDPFLQSADQRTSLPLSAIKTDTNPRQQGQLHSPKIISPTKAKRRTDMTITGKMNPEDDTIFLKVQIADKDGQVRNIYFPFDIYSDTAIDVANEMVRELEITDRDPSEIAEVIAQEISTLVPQWKDGGEAAEDRCHHEYSYKDDADEGAGHPFHYLSSPNSSCQGSVFGTNQCQWSCNRNGEHCQDADWLGDELFHNDDDETSSIHSGKYSAVNYSSGNEHDDHSHNQSQAQPNCHKHQKSTRFCPEESIQVPNLSSLATKFQRVQCNAAAPEGSAGSRGGKRPVDHDCLTRNRSFVDIRSQLLHRTLVEELNRRRMFKTVGAVENIGFQMPCDGGSRTGPSSSSSKGGHRKQWHGWGRS
ncbi:putative serine/threonine-protein kinase WNK5 [Iris pallida]|uniref:non-specific serine/threonine protein kinase n=1 Tax=Iris pallida TaxID=29817 RepID=A0AAX6GSU6_IRIPA|nr:putative serine/threonine-protein kinase WNK5 [Iris pallida]